ncbi:hypothetical protein PHMEG_00018518 [Phytophthora megakarya]|uniref:Uncharacterized protein n=1 Tax=Phytophthora megakarya TaxID=4795 RepID=A0A225VTW6_9STRA|nr:hypothetical protein PHMEG_00018518 [Phytophthora megakarya]
MEVFQRDQRDEITRLEAEISTLTHDAGDDPDGLHAQVLQLRTERNDFERRTISAREDLNHAEADRDRLRLEATQAGDEIRGLQEQVCVLERATDDARSESATALASYNRISSQLPLPQQDHGGESSLGQSNRLAQADRNRALADLALARATLTQVTSDRDRAFKQLAQTTEDRDRALVDCDTALQHRDQTIAERDQVRLDLYTEAARAAQLDDDLGVLAHDQLGKLRDLTESDLNEADTPAGSARAKQLGYRNANEAHQPEVEGQEHEEIEDQPEIEGPEGEGTEDKPEIPTGGGGGSDDGGSSPSDHDPRRLHRRLPDLPEGVPVVVPPAVAHLSEASIPLYSTVKIFTAVEIAPWDPAVVGTVPILVMIPATLTKRLPIPPGFLFPVRTPFVRAPIPVTGYRSELITGANVLALMATELWRLLRQNHPTPLTFDHNLHRRDATPLWRIAVSYAALEEDHLIAYWESTHYLEITKAMAAADHDLLVYHQDRRQRRIRAGESWRRMLGEVVLMMRAQWADIDVLLDPYFLHLPTTRDWLRWYPGSVSRATNLAQPTANLPEPTDLLFECD